MQPCLPKKLSLFVRARATTLSQKNAISCVSFHRALSTAAGNSSLPYLQQLFSLEGRACLVTGGGTGIGAALALGLARAGARVALTGRRVEPLQQSAEAIQAQLVSDGFDLLQDDNMRNRAVAVPGDITNFESIPSILAECQEKMGGIPPTILINNAGVNVRQKAGDLEKHHWDQSLHLMLTAPFELTRAMSDNFVSEKYGRVISMASLQSYRAFPDSIPYAAAKSGVLGLTRALSEAYSTVNGYDGVTCNAIAPGYVKTELTASVFADQERSQRLADATLLGRNSVPDDLVGATLFLASPAAAYVTGQTLPVDGGFTALGLR